ncbi:hypothetical protein [Neokomagataea thailandica]|uniref:N-acetyltransferase domain-containing protein n=1 Tax=Neokomagataea tanensis NBRC 106556 TaxID=1223519 RepID=A0ABQ0QK92_9PROT|nr:MULTISPECIES: hypothetical protein [Neokomagataea]GBR47763.1 hypothetical protein AA106556_1569 [Neokomagataea tanensis NBRC 106556]
MTSVPSPISPPDSLVIRPVVNKRHIQKFITLPRRLYMGMAGYVAPLDMEQNDLLNPRKSAVFRHARIRYFMAWRGKTPVGRIAAIVDHRALEHWGQAVGSFAALDCVPEQAVVTALLAAAKAWLIQQGMQVMRGPVTLSGNGESGLMIDGQDQAPMVGMSWHPKALGKLFEAAGLVKTEDLLSYRLELDEHTEEKFRVPGDLKIGEGRLGAISVARLSRSQIASQGEVLRQLYNDAWDKKYNFVPLQDYEMAAMIAQLKLVLKPEHYVQIDQDGVPVAMALVVPNVFDIAGDLNGSPSPLGWVRLASRLLQHRFQSARVILLGVTRRLQGTMLGALLPSLAIAELLRRRHALPYRWVELGWIQESDTGMKNLAEAIVPEPYKRHRLYEVSLSAE